MIRRFAPTAKLHKGESSNRTIVSKRVVVPQRNGTYLLMPHRAKTGRRASGTPLRDQAPGAFSMASINCRAEYGLRRTATQPARLASMAGALVIERGHEDDRQIAVRRRKLTPQFKSGHAAKMDVQQQAIELRSRLHAEETLPPTRTSRSQYHAHPAGPGGPEHAWIVVDDRNNPLPFEHECPASASSGQANTGAASLPSSL